MVDASCTIWQDDCGERGSCWVYDHSELALRVCLLGVAYKLLSLTFHALTIFFYKPPQDDTKSDGLELTDNNSKGTLASSDHSLTNNTTD